MKVVKKQYTLSSRTWTTVDDFSGSGYLNVYFHLYPKSPNSIIVLTTNLLIGGNTGNGNLFLRWRFTEMKREDYVSVSKKDVSGPLSRIAAGWGIQTQQHKENYSSSFNVSIHRTNIAKTGDSVQYILQYRVKDGDTLYINRQASQISQDYIDYTTSSVMIEEYEGTYDVGTERDRVVIE